MPKAASPPAGWRRAAWGVALLSAVIILTIVFLIPRNTGDTWVSLAAGRDVLQGRLAQADDWAFTTAGRVWIDQNWGSGLVFYLAYQAAGESGLLVTKALLLVLLTVLVALAARQRGASGPGACLLAAGVTLAARSYVDLRPNLVGLDMLALVLLSLYVARRSARWIWVAFGTVLVWANVHGSFVLGLAMMALWTGCAIVAARRQARFSLRELWPLPVATILAVVLSVIVTPFGTRNLTEFLVVAREPAWREVAEWWPIFKTGSNPFGTMWEFFLLLSVLLASLAARSLPPRSSSRLPRPRRAPMESAAFIFDVIAVLVVVVMAIRARRFIPTSLVVLAPILIARLDAWLVRRRLWALTAVAALLVLPALAYGSRVARHYSSANPLYHSESFLQRMLQIEQAPVTLCEFARRNDISGKVLNEWTWEGYLRWCAPQLKLFVGGRAQAVYPVDIHKSYLNLVHGDSPAAWASRSGAHWVAGPTWGSFGGVFAALLFAENSRWACVYFDGLSMMLADVTAEETRGLVERAKAGTLSFPTDLTRQLSRAMYLASPTSGTDPATAVEALQRAVSISAAPALYEVLLTLSQQASNDATPLVRYLEVERKRLAALPEAHGSTMQLLMARRAVALILAGLYGTSPLEKNRRLAEECRQEDRRLRHRLDELTVF